MNQKHRDTIDLHCNNIVPKIDIIKLWPKLLEHKVFNRDDVNIPRWKTNLTNIATIQDIYLNIKTRGPQAFNRFLTSLKQSDHESLANILEGKNIVRFLSNDVERNINQNVNINENNVEEINLTESVKRVQDNFFYNIQLSDVPLHIQVRKSTKFLDGPVYENVQTYPMRSKPRGLVLIITNIDFKYSDTEPRNSAGHDELNLKKLFEQMGFQVIPYRDLTGKELLKKIKEFSQLKELRTVDSCFIIISSHGNTNTEYEVTEVQGVDYDPNSKEHNYTTVLCSDIVNNFTTEACPNLAGKPKIFIFQLCRGDKKQKLVQRPRYTTDTCNIRSSDEMSNRKMNGQKIMRNNADTLIIHATLPGYVAFRDTITGSWFIQILCEVFMNYAHETHLRDLLNMVDERLKTLSTTKEECQTVMVTSIGFNRHCYLNPGLFEDA